MNPSGFNKRIKFICYERCADVGDPACWRLPDLVDPCEHITPCSECFSAYVTELEAQRDELLEALVDIAKNETMSANATVRRMSKAARAAIAKAKETQ